MRAARPRSAPLRMPSITPRARVSSRPTLSDTEAVAARALPARRFTSAATAAKPLAALPARATDQQSFDQIERGRYLATAADCTGCHTKPGGKPFAGGVALATPFGTILGFGLTMVVVISYLVHSWVAVGVAGGHA